MVQPKFVHSVPAPLANNVPWIGDRDGFTLWRAYFAHHALKVWNLPTIWVTRVWLERAADSIV
jgi:hypothetical protein